MRIIGLMVCGSGEAERWLEKPLKDFSRLCDDAIIVCNNTDKTTEKLIAKYGFWQYRDDREWGTQQPYIKTDLLKRIANLKPDWIIALDADEEFDTAFTREKAEELTKQGEIAFHFYIVNLWNDINHYYRGLSFWNIRFYQFRPDLGLEFQKKRLHCGLAPPAMYYYGWNAPYFVKHYGLLTSQDRDVKGRRYEQYDPKALFKGKEYYDVLKTNPQTAIFNEQEIRQKLSSSKETQKRDKKPNIITMENKEFVYVRRLADGAPLDIPINKNGEISVGGMIFNVKRGEKDLSKSGFEYIGEAQISSRPEMMNVPIIEDDDVSVKEPEVKEDSLQCPLCGYEAKDKRALQGHKRFKHEAIQRGRKKV